MNILKNKKIIIVSIITIVILLSIATIIVILNKRNSNDTEISSNQIELLEQEIILDLDTTGYNEAEEVAVIIEDENNITVLSKTDTEYNAKTENKVVEIGVISDGKVKLTTKNEILLNIAKLDKEELASKIKIAEKVIPEETEATEEQQTESTEVAQVNNNNNNGSDSSVKQSATTTSNNGGSKTTTTSNKSSNGGSNSKSSSSTSSSSSSKSNTSSSSSSSSSGTTKGATPTGEFHYKHNASLENQIVSAINQKMKNTVDEYGESLADWGGKAVKGSGPNGQFFTYRSLEQCKSVANTWGTYHVYVTDEYCVYSDGSETKTGKSLVYIQET